MLCNKNIKKSSREKNYFWESSLTDDRKEKKLFMLPRKRESIRQNLERKSDVPHKLQELFMTREISTSISNNFVKTSDNLDKGISVINEEKSSTEHSSRNFFKPCIEMYLEKDRSDYIIHTYARPKRLVSVKETKSIKNTREKKFLSPNVKIGISGWKLSKPKTAKNNHSLKQVGKYKRIFLQITPKLSHY